MHKIAIILFPGLNTEYETRREITRAGMRAEFFRWNESVEKLKKFDGYVIGGGFSYEDRGRAGVIASLDPVMQALREETAKGKPLLGICNGAQIIVEAGFIPGVDGEKLVMALARNKRMKEGKVLGTGYYNAWTHLQCSAAPGSCMFTWNMHHGERLQAPIAHGEGRFTTEIPGLMRELHEKGRIALRYCDSQGIIGDEFPVNPNGSMFSAAAICNPSGNVMAVMPHLERDSVASEKLFSSMRDAITALGKGGAKRRVHHVNAKSMPMWPVSAYELSKTSLHLFVSLIIIDNEAETFQMTAKKLGFDKISLERMTHIELKLSKKTDNEKLMKRLIQSGVLLNTNKEVATVKFSKEKLFFDARREKFMPVLKETIDEKNMTFKLLVREKPDFVGMSKLRSIQHGLGLMEVSEVLTGTLWKITVPTKSRSVAEGTLKQLTATNLFWNPHRQEAYLV